MSAPETIPLPSTPRLEPLTVDCDGVRQLLGADISDTTIWRLEKQELIRRVPKLGARRYSIASIRSYVDGTGNGRTA